MTLVVLLNFKFNLELVETAAMSSVQTAKKLLRSNMKKTLNALSQEEIQNQSKCVFDQVSSNPLFQNAAVISCYLSMPTAELNTNNIVRSILREGKVLFVPRIDSSRGEIDMLRVYDEEDLDSLIPKKWGIREPALDRNGTLRTNALDTSSPPLDLVLMPGVAFDKTFSRLGHGKGYYDRFLLTYNSVRTQNQQSAKMPELYALSFTEQILPSSVIPITDHDWQLDGIFHPEGVLMRMK